MIQVAVLIPCYNEAQTIEKVVTDFKAILPIATIYVYDNNSTDGTAALAEKAGAIVRHEYQQGKGNVMRRMFREIDADAYILVDGDDTYPAEDRTGNGTARSGKASRHGRWRPPIQHLLYPEQAAFSQFWERPCSLLHQPFIRRRDQRHYDRLPRVQPSICQIVSCSFKRDSKSKPR